MNVIGLVLAMTPPSDFTFDHIERAHSSLSSAAFTASYALTGAGGEAGGKYEIRYRWPDQFRLRTFKPGTSTLLRERVIEIGRVIEFDPALQQYISKERKKRGNAGELLVSLDEGLDPFIIAFSEQEAFEVWLSPMRSQGPWTVSKEGTSSVLSFKKGEKKITLRSDWMTGRITKLDVVTGPQRLVWDLKYASQVGPLVFSAPRGSIEVPAFDMTMKPPKYQDANARTVSEKMFDAYNGLTSLGFDVQRDSGTTKVQVRGTFARQDDDAAVWTYDGTTLTLFEKYSEKWFRGKMSFVEVIDEVPAHGSRVDPTLMLLYRRYNPYRKRLGDDVTVKVVGSMDIEGQRATILQADNEVSTITLFVRDKDGMVIGSSTRAREIEATDNGMVDLKYKYFAVPNDLAARSKLSVPQGQTPISIVVKKP